LKELLRREAELQAKATAAWQERDEVMKKLKRIFKQALGVVSERQATIKELEDRIKTLRSGEKF
jgi:uncharacterized coiled-coil DUF342 family protein